MHNECINQILKNNEKMYCSMLILHCKSVFDEMFELFSAHDMNLTKQF